MGTQTKIRLGNKPTNEVKMPFTGQQVFGDESNTPGFRNTFLKRW